MFRLRHIREDMKVRERELLKKVKLSKKPQFKDLLSLVFAQYIIILPFVFIGIIIFLLISRGILYLWGA